MERILYLIPLIPQKQAKENESDTTKHWRYQSKFHSNLIWITTTSERHTVILLFNVVRTYLNVLLNHSMTKNGLNCNNVDLFSVEKQCFTNGVTSQLYMAASLSFHLSWGIFRSKSFFEREPCSVTHQNKNRKIQINIMPLKKILCLAL